MVNSQIDAGETKYLTQLFTLEIVTNEIKIDQYNYHIISYGIRCVILYNSLLIFLSNIFIKSYSLCIFVIYNFKNKEIIIKKDHEELFLVYKIKTTIWYIYISKQNKNIADTNLKFLLYQILKIHSLY